MLDNWTPSGLQVILFAIGGGLLYLGQDWGVPWASEVGIGFLGALLIAIGLDTILKRLTVFGADGWANVVESYRGALAMLWGVIFVLAGVLMAAVVIMNALVPGGVGELWRDWLLGSTGMGVLLSLVGMLLMLNGLIRALAGSAVATLARMGTLSRAVDRLTGAIWLGVGMAITAVGLLLLVAPGWIAAGTQFLLGLLR